MVDPVEIDQALQGGFEGSRVIKTDLARVAETGGKRTRIEELVLAFQNSHAGGIGAEGFVDSVLDSFLKRCEAYAQRVDRFGDETGCH